MVQIAQIHPYIKTWSVAEVGKTYAKINWGTAETVDWVRVYLNDSSQWTDNPGSVNGHLVHLFILELHLQVQVYQA